MLTASEFAARIRSKYPGAYDDLPDDELTSRILAKFPEYGDMVSAPANPPQKISTKMIDAIPGGAAEVKRRAAAGEPVVQEGLRRASPLQEAGSVAVNAAGGFMEGLAQAATVPIDYTADVVTAGPARRAIAAIAGEKSAPQRMPLTEGVTRLTDRGIVAAENAIGVDPNVATSAAGDVARFAGNVAAPGPEVLLARKAMGAGKVAGEIAADAAPLADDAARMAENAAADAGTVPPELAGARSGAEISPVAADVAKAPDVDLEKYAAPSAINLERLNIPDDAKQTIVKTAQAIAPDLEKAKGATLSADEVLNAAASSPLLTEVRTRAETLASEARMLRTRQHLAAMAKTGKVTTDFVDTLRQVSAEASDLGRRLQSLQIAADPHLAAAQTDIVKKLVGIGVSTEDIVKAAEGVDLNDAKQAADLYRKFVKPRLGEVLDEFRYVNMLSSPKTHIVNAFSNILQAALLRPADRLASGVVDNFGRFLPNAKAQEHYIAQVPAYFRGVLSALEPATREAIDALRGLRQVHRPDLAHIRTSSPLMKPFEFIPRALEASDIFFRKLAESGEFEALSLVAKKSGQPVNEAEIAKLAARNAEEMVFRKPLDPENASGHGNLLSGIDNLTSAVYALRRVPGVKWFVPFVETPMNILKQGIEHSPLGLATLAGSTRKTEQVAKAMVGSTVMAGAGLLALQGRSTWAPPRNAKERAAFYAAGLQPYAVKIGDTWVSYSKLGPLSYPIAMAAAMKFYADDPNVTDKNALGAAARVIGGIGEFFSDQSYVQGIGDLLDAARGNESVMARAANNFVTQVVPLSGLLRWVTNIVDPIYRKSPKEISVDALIQGAKRGIPGLSTDVPPQLTPTGEPSPRPMPGVNAVSPLNVSQENPAMLQEYRDLDAAGKERARERAAKKPVADASAAIQRLRQETAPLSREAGAQVAAAKAGVYVDPDGRETPIPRALMLSALRREDPTEASSPMMRWLAGMQKQKKIRSGGRVEFRVA